MKEIREYILEKVSKAANRDALYKIAKKSEAGKKIGKWVQSQKVLKQGNYPKVASDIAKGVKKAEKQSKGAISTLKKMDKKDFGRQAAKRFAAAKKAKTPRSKEMNLDIAKDYVKAGKKV